MSGFSRPAGARHAPSRHPVLRPVRSVALAGLLTALVVWATSLLVLRWG
jgi:hypothetical protein